NSFPDSCSLVGRTTYSPLGLSVPTFLVLQLVFSPKTIRNRRSRLLAFPNDCFLRQIRQRALRRHVRLLPQSHYIGPRRIDVCIRPRTRGIHSNRDLEELVPSHGRTPRSACNTSTSGHNYSPRSVVHLSANPG